MCKLESILCVLMILFTDETMAQPVTAIPAAGFPYISNSSRQYLNNELDGVSDPIYIPYGFAFGEETFTKAYVGTNGVISFGKPFHLWHPCQFPSNDPSVNSANVLAPYWSDNDIRSSGEISYGSFQYADSLEGNNLLEAFSSSISLFYPNASDFEGNFMIIAEWDRVHPFPHGSLNLTNILNNNPSIYNFIEMTNTYQAVAITDGTDSYAVFTYECNLLQWTGLWSQPVIGFNANGALYYNHPYSSLSNANEIACIYNVVSNYTAVIFKTSSEPGPIQIQRQSCWRWYFDDIRYFQSVQRFYQYAPSCPCTVYQARFDSRWNYAGENPLGSCFISDVQNFGVGQLCCYHLSTGIYGAPILNGQYSGGFLLYHPFVNFREYEFYDLFPKQNCCSVDLCNIFQQRRPLQTCSEGYQLQKLSWAWGDPHFTTIDGRTYTFNGLGEYVLLRVGASNFEIQGRATRLINESSATFFTALAIGTISSDNVIQVEVFNDTSLKVTDRNGRVLRQTDPSSITFTFFADNEITVMLYAGYLNIRVQLSSYYAGFVMGLLGNYNGNASDEFVFQNGTVLDDSASDREIHQFAQSWQIQTNEDSLFIYNNNDNYVSTYTVEDHQPPFLDEIKDELLANTQLSSVCGSNLQCLFDYNQTGSPSIGLFATRFQEDSESMLSLYSTFSPSISAPQVFFGMVGSESSYTISITSSVGVITFAINGVIGNSSLPNNMRLLVVNSTTFSLLWMPLDHYENFVLDVISHVLIGEIPTAYSLFRPQIHLCNCQNGGTCTTDGVLQYDDNFILLRCICSTGYTGEFCEELIDDCDLISCLEGGKCVNGVGCPCPEGYLTSDSKCIDVDECSVNGGPCQQVCTNIPSGYECSCLAGYLYNDTNNMCEDVDECVDTYHGCHHSCQNTIGSYICTCYNGFILAEDDERSCEVSENFTCEFDDCSQLCTNISSELRCSCELGYEIQIDGVNCSDVDECINQPAPCSQRCNNTDGSFICSCDDGYYLGDDSITCYDINECMMPAQYSCPDGMICKNVEGRYDCDCPPGTKMNNLTECVLHIITEQSTSVPPMATTIPLPSSTSSLGETSPTSTVSADSEASNDLPPGTIVGIAIGAILAALGAILLLIGGIIVYPKFSYWRARRILPESK